MPEMLNLFGPNISTVSQPYPLTRRNATQMKQAEGPAWQKQRKITASSFNERNMKLVWDESLRQATEMLNWWKMHDNKGVRSTARNISTLTLHVISTVGFGKSYPFQSSIETVKKDSSMNYRDALSLILENVMLILILGPKLLGRLSQPKKLARLGQATMIFKQYMTDMYEEEKGLVAQGKSKSGNLMTSLIRASDEVAHAGSGLTENEIYGNMFIISFAGHDTTAHTLTFTINLLAAHPEVQNWMREELQYYLHDDAPSNLSYEESFPKLKRTLAVFVSILACLQHLVSVLLQGLAKRINSWKPSAFMIPSSESSKPQVPGLRLSLWPERP
jgi:cytochrome P450